MSDWPVWRTSIPAARAAGLGPHWMGVCGILLGLPLASALTLVPLGWALRALNPAHGLGQSLLEVGVFICLTPLASWMGLVVAVPLAAALARRGYAGWAVALLGGALAGGFVALWLGSWGDASGVAFFAFIGALFGGVYWLSARLLVPAAFASVSGGGNG